MIENNITIKKILIVEDQDDIRMLIRMTLNFDHYEIHEASDALMGLSMVQQIKPDMVLLDIMMPARSGASFPAIKDGLDLCKHLKNDPEYADIPIVFLSAKGKSADQELGLAAGANKYLVKPFSPIYLIELVDLLINKKQS